MIESGYRRIRKIALPRFSKRVEKDMEHDSQGYTTSYRCSMSNSQKLRNWLKEIGIKIR